MNSKLNCTVFGTIRANHSWGKGKDYWGFKEGWWGIFPPVNMLKNALKTSE